MGERGRRTFFSFFFLFFYQKANAFFAFCLHDADYQYLRPIKKAFAFFAFSKSNCFLLIVVTIENIRDAGDCCLFILIEHLCVYLSGCEFTMAQQL